MPTRTLCLDAHGPAVAFLDPEDEPRGDERLLRAHSVQEAAALLERISPAAAGHEVLKELLAPELGYAMTRMGSGELRSAAATRLVAGRLRLVERRGSPALTWRGDTFRVLDGGERTRRGESAQSFFDRESALRFVSAMWEDVWSRHALEEAAYQSTGAGRGEATREVLARFAERLAARRIQLVRLSPMDGALPTPTLPLPAEARVARAAAPRLQLCELPEVMERSLGWTIAPRLMRSWFERPYYPMRDAVKQGDVDPMKLVPSVVDESIVRMDWVLRHPPARAAYDNFVRGSWNTPKGRERLAEQIARAIKDQGICSLSWRFGDLSAPRREVDSRYQVNIAPLETNVTDTIDEWYGAIGNALLKVAVSGLVTHRVPGRFHIAVDTLGIYLRDTYDFNDGVIAQLLGKWSRTGVSKSGSFESISVDRRYGSPPAAQGPAEETGAGYNVRNQSFVDYRERHRMGGDFVIFSNVVPVRLPRPVVLDLPVPRS